MIRKLGEFMFGQASYYVFCDENTPLAKIDKIDYLFRPPKIELSCIYVRVRRQSGIIIEPPVNLRLKLTGNLIDISKEEILIDGVEDYIKHQLFDFRIRFCVSRTGIYDLYYSDKRKDEWILLTDKIFIPGVGKSEYFMSVGSGSGPTIKGKTTRIYFNIYNSEASVIEVDVLGQGFFVEEFDYTTLGKYRMYVDISADNVSREGLTKIIFRRDDLVEFVSYFYNKE